MEVKTIKDSPILIPNKEHKNFTRTNEIIPNGTIINGEPKSIQGKRRGEDFTYKLFLTDKKQLIHLKNTNAMNTTEIKLGADGDKVVTIPTEKTLFTKNAKIYALIGAGLFFTYSKFVKKNENKRVAMCTSIGAVLGFALGTYVDKNKSVTVK